MFTIRPLGDDTYYFTMSGKRHSATVGYLYRQASTTLVTIQQERNWMLFAVLVLGILLLGLVEVKIVTDTYHTVIATAYA